MSPMLLGDDERARALARAAFWQGFCYGVSFGAILVVGLLWWGGKT